MVTPVLAKGTLLAMALAFGTTGIQLAWSPESRLLGLGFCVLAVICAYGREIIKPLVNK